MQALKVLVIGMGVLIIVGFVVVVVTLASRLSGTGKSGFGEVPVEVPEGCNVHETQVDGDRLLLRLDGPAARGCHQIVVVDLRAGKVQGRVRLLSGP